METTGLNLTYACYRPKEKKNADDQQTGTSLIKLNWLMTGDTLWHSCWTNYSLPWEQHWQNTGQQQCTIDSQAKLKVSHRNKIVLAAIPRHRHTRSTKTRRNRDTATQRPMQKDNKKTDTVRIFAKLYIWHLKIYWRNYVVNITCCTGCIFCLNQATEAVLMLEKTQLHKD